jgi:GNAT superfamily N-acetyltransferase
LGSLQIEIRRIQAQETYHLRHEVMWPDRPLDFIKLDNDEDGIHFGLFKNNDIVSVVSLFVNGHSAQFRKLATKTSEQSKGYGRRLLQYLINYVEGEGNIHYLWCNARVDKAGFYKHFGMKQTDRKFQKSGQDYCIMEKYFHDILNGT